MQSAVGVDRRGKACKEIHRPAWTGPRQEAGHCHHDARGRGMAGSLFERNGGWGLGSWDGAKCLPRLFFFTLAARSSPVKGATAAWPTPQLSSDRVRLHVNRPPSFVPWQTAEGGVSKVTAKAVTGGWASGWGPGLAVTKRFSCRWRPEEVGQDAPSPRKKGKPPFKRGYRDASHFYVPAPLLVASILAPGLQAWPVRLASVEKRPHSPPSSCESVVEAAAHPVAVGAKGRPKRQAHQQANSAQAHPMMYNNVAPKGADARSSASALLCSSNACVSPSTNTRRRSSRSTAHCTWTTCSTDTGDMGMWGLDVARRGEGQRFCLRGEGVSGRSP